MLFSRLLPYNPCYFILNSFWRAAIDEMLMHRFICGTYKYYFCLWTLLLPSLTFFSCTVVSHLAWGRFNSIIDSRLSWLFLRSIHKSCKILCFKKETYAVYRQGIVCSIKFWDINGFLFTHDECKQQTTTLWKKHNKYSLFYTLSFYLCNRTVTWTHNLLNSYNQKYV